MKTYTNIFSVFVLMTLLLSVVSIYAEDTRVATQDEMMAVYMKYATPGQNHKLLEPLIGSWNVSTKFQMGPDAPMDTSSGTSECKWILGGRFVSEEVTGNMGGMPFHGLGLTGYDNYKQKFFNIWMDEMSTTYMISAGAVDSSGKIFTLTGTYEDYLTGGKVKLFKMVTRIISADKHVNEMYDTVPDGKEYKTFEATYTRVK
jgi:hypothetical protein